MGISETGQQIGEKLFVLLDEPLKNELTKYVLENRGINPHREAFHSYSSAC